MSYRTRIRETTAIIYRNASERLLTQLLNSGRAVLSPAEQEALQAEQQGVKPGPMTMARLKGKRKRRTIAD